MLTRREFAFVSARSTSRFIWIEVLALAKY